MTTPRRARHAMPDDVRRALTESGLHADYDDRPAYQRNDYIGWIERSKRPSTRQKRTNQMLDELRTGGVYMGMVHAPSRRSSTLSGGAPGSP
jgi:uncharacterized protein YdeI (YjbR/CyaY-like superfamily)